MTVAGYTEPYSPVLSTVYAHSLNKQLVGMSPSRQRKQESTDSELSKMAQESRVATGMSQPSAPRAASAPGIAGACVQVAATKHYILQANGRAVSLDDDSEISYACGAANAHAQDPASDQPSTVDPEWRRKEEARQKIQDSKYHAACKHWKDVANRKSWDEVVPSLEVYRYSGAVVKHDHRRKDSYRQQVLDGCKISERKDLTAPDKAALEEVIWRKAAAFWIEDTPRTTLRHLLHDTIPTGPPVRTPPHHLKGEIAEWVDKELQDCTLTGQLERGNSEWASPPFATKDFAEHR